MLSPKFLAFREFPQTNNVLTTQMKSVGEVMAIGRNFQESLQKAMRGLEVGVCGFDPKMDLTHSEEEIKDALVRELKTPHPIDFGISLMRSASACRLRTYLD